jgi:hypothetical protein
MVRHGVLALAVIALASASNIPLRRLQVSTSTVLMLHWTARPATLTACSFTADHAVQMSFYISLLVVCMHLCLGQFSARAAAVLTQCCAFAVQLVIFACYTAYESTAMRIHLSAALLHELRISAKPVCLNLRE